MLTLDLSFILNTELPQADFVHTHENFVFNSKFGDFVQYLLFIFVTLRYVLHNGKM